jgi:hypothetical protein
VVITAEGALTFSKDGNSWSRALVATDEPFTDVVMDGKGNGLALSASGKLFETDTDGSEFRPLPKPQHRVARLTKQGQQLFALFEEPSDRLQRSYVLEAQELTERAPARFLPATPLRHENWRPDFAHVASSRWLGLRERESSDGNLGFWEGALVAFGQLPTFRRLDAMTGRCAPLAQPFAALAFLAECGDEHRVRLVFAVSMSFRTIELADLKASDFGQGFGDMLHRVSEGQFLAALPCSEKSGPQLIDTRTGLLGPLAEQPCREYQALSEDVAAPLAVVTSRNGLALCRWSAKHCKSVARLPAPAGARASSVTVAGANVLVVMRTGTTEVVLRSSDGGLTYAPLSLPNAKDVRVRFAGMRGFLLDSAGRGFESNDAGSSWHRVQAGSGEPTQRLECAAAGCLADFGLRIGWSLP